MKTALIYDEGNGIDFYVIDGDYRHLNDVFINEFVPDDSQNVAKLHDELGALMYDDDGKCKFEPVTLEQFTQAIRDGAEPIVCGFLP